MAWRQLAFVLIIVVTDLCPLKARTAEQPPPQLYIYANPEPKRGYIEVGEATGQTVRFRECDSDTFIVVERDRLKPDEGDCKKRSPNRGTWIYTFDRTSEGTVVLKDPNTGTMVSTFTKQQWDEKTSTSVDLLGSKLKTGDYVGVSKFGDKESIFAIAPSAPPM